MSLDINEIKKIAHLGRLSIVDKTEAELNSLATDLNKIFQLVDQMQTVDTTNIPPMAHPLNTTLRTRSDKVTCDDERDENQKIAPKVEYGLYLVPQVIE